MIYLVRSYLKGGKSILKIGYTQDGNDKRRLDTYIYHNPGIEVINTIPLATEEQEHKLHYKFQHLKYEKFNEWFEDSEEIVNFVNSATLDDLNNLQDIVLAKPQQISLKFWIENNQSLRYLVGNLIKKVTPTDEFIDLRLFSKLMTELKYIGGLSLETALDYLLSLPNFINIEEATVEKLIPVIPKDIQDWLDITYDSKFIIRFRNICESILTMGISKEDLEKYLPEPFNTYYFCLGPEFLKSVSYQKSELDIVIGKISNKKVDKNSLQKVIYETFKEGDRIPKSTIKEKLGKIYNTLGIPQTPKAKDIEDWFVVKTISVYIPATKKNCAGFELISKKNN